MERTRPHQISGLLAAALVLGTGGSLLAGPAALAAAEPEPTDTVAPSGTYQLNTTSIWAAQTVLLTQSALVDPDTAAADVTRVVSWGDGGTETIGAGARTIRHAYARVGSYPVSVQLTDDTGNQAAGTITGTATVTVTGTPGTFRLSRTTGLTYRVFNAAGTQWRESNPVPLTVTMSGIPTNVSRVRVDWGDNFEILYPRTSTQVTLRYFSDPAVNRLLVSMENANGQSVERPIGTFKVTLDTIDPTLSINKPAAPTKASSWSTITGKAADKGIGVHDVMVSLVQVRGSKFFYYTGSVWKKASSGDDAARRSANVKAAYTKGTWKIKIKGMKKGFLQVAAFAEEPGGAWSGWRYREQNITR